MARFGFIPRFLTSVIASLALAGSGAHAWGTPGHRKVGAIADTILKSHPRAARQVQAILGGLTLEQVGPWGDCVRSITAPSKGLEYKPEKESYRCPTFETPDRMQVMKDYVRTNWDNCTYRRDDGCHTQYHFVNLVKQRKTYEDRLVGTRDYDIVRALNAAVAVLRTPACSGDQPNAGEVPAPGVFHFTCAQALMMLVHLVGDIHQPLHVASVYLDKNGQEVDPDSSPAARAQAEATSTYGGNSLAWMDGERLNKLHSVWDGYPGAPPATKVPATPGPITEWPGKWATDTLQGSAPAFAGLQYGAKKSGNWPITFANQSQYEANRVKLQKQQIRRAGVRLAQLLVAIWPGK